MIKYRIHKVSIFENRHLFNVLLERKTRQYQCNNVHIYTILEYTSHTLQQYPHKNFAERVLHIYRTINTTRKKNLVFSEKKNFDTFIHLCFSSFHLYQSHPSATIYISRLYIMLHMWLLYYTKYKVVHMQKIRMIRVYHSHKIHCQI